MTNFCGWVFLLLILFYVVCLIVDHWKSNSIRYLGKKARKKISTLTDEYIQKVQTIYSKQEEPNVYKQ